MDQPTLADTASLLTCHGTTAKKMYGKMAARDDSFRELGNGHVCVPRPPITTSETIGHQHLTVVLARALEQE